MDINMNQSLNDEILLQENVLQQTNMITIYKPQKLQIINIPES